MYQNAALLLAIVFIAVIAYYLRPSHQKTKKKKKKNNNKKKNNKMNKKRKNNKKKKKKKKTKNKNKHQSMNKKTSIQHTNSDINQSSKANAVTDYHSNKRKHPKPRKQKKKQNSAKVPSQNNNNHLSSNNVEEKKECHTKSLTKCQLVNNACQSIQKCQSFVRLKKCLIFYQELNVQNYNLLLKYFVEKQYSFLLLLNDYIHILNKHISNNQKNKIELNNNFKYIYYNIVNDMKTKCKLQKCKIYNRNNRNREKEIINLDHNDALLKTYIDTLDTIHCCIIHSIDTGFRIMHNYNYTPTISDDDTLVLYVDNEMKRIESIIKEKRQLLKQINDNNDRLKINKYTTKTTFAVTANDVNNINGVNDENTILFIDRLKSYLLNTKKMNHQEITKLFQFLINNNYDSDSIFDDLENGEEFDEKTKTSESNLDYFMNMNVYNNMKQFAKLHKEANKSDEYVDDVSYSFGLRYFYWDWFKNKNDNNDVYDIDIPSLKGHKFKFWYISKKYINLKQEMLHNNIHTLSVCAFEQRVVMPANQLIHTEFAKSIIAAEDEYMTSRLLLRYGIISGSSITCKHLMSLILYCSFTCAQNEFTKTFRKRFKTEKILFCKKRNREFANWSKLLLETVNIFGTNMKKCDSDQVYYHGISKLNFNTLRGHFSSPTSTSTQIEVASIFAGENGIIMELAATDHTMAFNCSWISSYSNEDERLYFHSFEPLSIVSIRDIGRNENYQYFITAIAKIDANINGDYCSDTRNNNNKLTTKLINQFINGKYEKYPNYVSEIFQTICFKQKNITIYYGEYQWIRSFLFDLKGKCKYYPLIKKICNLFRNCNDITVNYNGDYADLELTDILDQLYLYCVSHSSVSIARKLCITLDEVKCDDATFAKYKLMFFDKDWLLETEKYGNDDLRTVSLSTLKFGNNNLSKSFKTDKKVLIFDNEYV